MIVTFDYLHERLKAACTATALPPPSPECLQMVLAIGLQESGFEVRRQYDNGPAASFWQMERGGGIRGVMNHAASREKARALCQACGTKFTVMDVWVAMQVNSTAADTLGAGFARLLLLTDPRPLPALDEPGTTPLHCPPYPPGGWGYYRWDWRPGKPHPDRWQRSWSKAREYVRVLGESRMSLDPDRQYDRYVRAFLSVIITIGFFAVVAGLFFIKDIPASIKDILLVMLGALLTSFKEITGYAFGSSSGSTAKGVDQSASLALKDAALIAAATQVPAPPPTKEAP